MIFLRRAGCQSRMIFGRAIIPLPTFRDHALVPFCHTVNALGAPRDVTAPRLLSLARFHPGHRRATLPARRADAVRWSTIKATVCHAPARRGARERAPSYAPVRPC